MKYTALMSLACLIIVGTGCQYIRPPSQANNVTHRKAAPPTSVATELRRLPSVDIVRLASYTTEYDVDSDLSNPIYSFSGGDLVELNDQSMWEWTKTETFSLWDDICQDHKNYYSWENATTTAGMLAMAASLAHSDADQEFRDAWQEDVRTSSWNDFSSIAHELGEGKYMITTGVAAASLGYLMYDTPAGDTVGEWGMRTSRSYLVGFPSLLFLQRATGASRPLDQSSAESDWVFFADENGVSGHAFVGAVPFMCAAQMTDNRLLASSLYICSSFTGISRVNDDAHYFSQVILGWWLAHISCKSTDETQSSRQVHVTPLPMSDGLGVGVIWQH